MLRHRVGKTESAGVCGRSIPVVAYPELTRGRETGDRGIYGAHRGDGLNVVFLRLTVQNGQSYTHTQLAFDNGPTVVRGYVRPSDEGLLRLAARG